ncbi:MAG: Epoxyqueuosine reductase [Lentisphaerae bacterium ADurb.Bin242]|nr:MAG: Epoxyqueuosine reductase [Lentisphaerae bacterium ADurb.Bin242]
MIPAAIVKEKARELGADLVGIAPVSRWDNAPAMLSPKAHLPEAKSVIAISIHHPDASVEWGGLPNSNYSGPFQLGMIPKLDTISWRLTHFLEKTGYPSIPFSCTGFWRHRPYKSIPTTNTASFSHRHAFVAAGLGGFGWNNMVLSAAYGPRNRLVSVITSAELEPDPLYSGEPLCDRCRMCEKHCPGKNYRGEMLLEPGYDRILIEGKEFRYAKLNRFRCLWGEQFALDMDRLGEVTEQLDEEKMYELIRSGIPRPGGEFGNCFRFCMTKSKRYWDKKYTEAPRRKKPRAEVTPETVLEKIRAIARAGGANRLCIQKNEFPEAVSSFVKGFPVEKFTERFPYVITLGRTLPEYGDAPESKDNRAFLSVTTKVRIGMAAMDIARYLDDLGWEATQDWTETNNEAVKRAGWKADVLGPARATSTGGAGCFDIIAERARNDKKNIVIAGMAAGDVERKNNPVSTNSLFTDFPLPTVNEPLNSSIKIASPEDLSTENPLFRDTIDRIAAAPVSVLKNLPGLADPEKLLPDCKSVVVLAAEMPERMVELAADNEAECAMSYSFSQYQLIRETLWAAHDLCEALNRSGFEAVPVADFSVDPKRNLAPYWEFAWSRLGHPDLRANAPAAAAAGLGEIGLSGLLLTNGAGPRLRFSFVLTTAILEPVKSKVGKLCTKCGKCIAACPMKALSADETETVELPDGRAEQCRRNEDKCRWSRSLGMCPESGVSHIGWTIRKGPVPEKLDEKAVEEARTRKDPLQLKGYHYANQIDTVVERCLQACPVGKKTIAEKEA